MCAAVPEQTSFLTQLLAHAKETLAHNAGYLGNSFINGSSPTWRSTEPIIAALCVAAMLVVIGLLGRARMSRLDDAVVPESRLSLATFVELFLGYFYDLAKSIMGPERAKKYFPVIGTSACFV